MILFMQIPRGNTKCGARKGLDEVRKATIKLKAHIS